MHANPNRWGVPPNASFPGFSFPTAPNRPAAVSAPGHFASSLPYGSGRNRSAFDWRGAPIHQSAPFQFQPQPQQRRSSVSPRVMSSGTPTAIGAQQSSFDAHISRMQLARVGTPTASPRPSHAHKNFVASLLSQARSSPHDDYYNRQSIIESWGRLYTGWQGKRGSLGVRTLTPQQTWRAFGVLFLHALHADTGVKKSFRMLFTQKHGIRRHFLSTDQNGTCYWLVQQCHRVNEKPVWVDVVSHSVSPALMTKFFSPDHPVLIFVLEYFSLHVGELASNNMKGFVQEASSQYGNINFGEDPAHPSFAFNTDEDPIAQITMKYTIETRKTDHHVPSYLASLFSVKQKEKATTITGALSYELRR